LSDWTKRPWLVGLSREQGAETLRQAGVERELQRKKDAANDPLVQAILLAFPGATVEAVRDLKPETAEDDAGDEPLPPPDPADSDWVLGDDE
jgi:DNA polymerase-3 subunit gamma/tau